MKQNTKTITSDIKAAGIFSYVKNIYREVTSQKNSEILNKENLRSEEIAFLNELVTKA